MSRERYTPEQIIGMLREADQPYLSGPVPMRDPGRFDRPVVTTGA